MSQETIYAFDSSVVKDVCNQTRPLLYAQFAVNKVTFIPLVLTVYCSLFSFIVKTLCVMRCGICVNPL